MEESNNSSFEFSSLFSSDGDWRETLPEDVLADVCSDEERNSRTKTVSFLQKFIEKNHNDSGGEQLSEDEDSVEGSEFRNFTVHSRQEVSEGFSESNNESEEFLSCLEKVSIFFGRLVNFDDLCSSQELHDHTRGDNGRDTQLHESTLVRGQDDSEPIQRIGSLLLDHTVEGDLTANQIDEEGDGSPDQLVVEMLLIREELNQLKAYLFEWLFDLREESHDWSHNINESDSV